jgi:hypothetical protein
MTASFLLVSSFYPKAARNAVRTAPFEVDLVAISPSQIAREAAEYAVGRRGLPTVEQPLLAGRALEETGPQVLARLGQALRELAVFETRATLVVIDGLDVLGASTFTLERPRPDRAARGLNRKTAQS